MEQLIKLLKNDKFQFYYKIVTICVLSVLIAASATFSIMRHTLIQRIEEEAVHSLSSITYTQETLFQQGDRIISSVASTPDIMGSGVLGGPTEQSKLLQAYRELERILVGNDFCSSISIVYLKEEKVLCTEWGRSSLLDYSRFCEESILAELELLSESGSRGLTLTTRSASRKRGNAVVMLRYLPINYTRTPKAVLAVTIDGEYLRETHSLMATRGGDYYMADASFQMIYGSNKAQFEALKEKMAEISFDESNVYSEIGKFAAKEQLITVVRQPEYQLYYFSVVPLTFINEDIQVLFNIIFTLTGFIILLGSFLAVIASRKAYRPLDSILGVVTNYEPKTYHIHELAQKIKGAYEENHHLVLKNRDLQDFIDKYQHNQQNHLLSRLLLEGYDKSSDDWRYLRLPVLEDGQFCVVLFSMDHLSGDSINERERLMELLLQHIAADFSGSFTTIPVEMEGRELCVLLNCGNVDIASAVFEGTKLLHYNVTNETGMEMTVGVSEWRVGVESVPECYRQAQSARDSRWFLGRNQVFQYRETQGEAVSLPYPYLVESQLIAALKANKPQELFAVLKEYYTHTCTSAHTDIALLRHYFLQLLSASYSCIYNVYNSVLHALPAEQQIYSQLLKQQTAEDMYLLLAEFYNQLFEMLQSVCSTRHTQLVSEVKAYIGDNYGEDLSPDSIAGVFSISASYLRKIFKENAGISLKSYLDEIRMKQAQRLLLTTELPLQDIIAQVGYISNQTFFRLFRKEFGMTPTEYRKCGKQSDPPESSS